MDRVLRNAGATISVSLYDSSGTLTNPTAGAITATVVDSAGAAISGSPFSVTNPPSTTGVLTFSLPSALNVLDTYQVTWNLAGSDGKRYTEFEMVGGFLFAIADFRAFDTALASTTAYPTTTVTDVREIVEDTFEHPRVTRRGFRRRGYRMVIDGSGTDTILVRHPGVATVAAASIDGVALTSGELADIQIYPDGRLVRDTLGVWTAGTRNVSVLYEYGPTSTPADVTRAAIEYARYLAVKSPLEDARATAIFTDIGGARLSVAGRDGWTGLPNVDAVLKRYTTSIVGGFA